MPVSTKSQVYGICGEHYNYTMGLDYKGYNNCESIVFKLVVIEHSTWVFHFSFRTWNSKSALMRC